MTASAFASAGRGGVGERRAGVVEVDRARPGGGGERGEDERGERAPRHGGGPWANPATRHAALPGLRAGLRAVRALLLAIALLVAAPAAAGGSVLAYTCGAAYENLCLAAPDGGSARPLTTDGDATGATSHRYSSPALSPDGGRLAYVADTDLWIRDLATGATLHGLVQSLPALIRWRHDGQRLAAAELALASSRPEVCSYAADLTGRNEGRYCLAGGVRSGFAYRPDGRIWMTIDGGTQYAGRTVLCTLGARGRAADGLRRRRADRRPGAQPRVAGRVAGRRADRRGAGAVGHHGRDRALRRAPRAASCAGCTDGPADGAPVFSPDGRQVAFARTRRRDLGDGGHGRRPAPSAA